MICVNQTYKVVKNCIGQEIDQVIKILDGPRRPLIDDTPNKPNEWCCEISGNRKEKNHETGETKTIHYCHSMWLGEDYLKNKLINEEMFLYEE